jgi:solute carrier family 25 protein 39/40
MLISRLTLMSLVLMPHTRHHALTKMLPADAWDAAMGAAAGAAAVLVSMPCDVVKTHVQTQGVGQLTATPAAQIALFLATGLF